MKRAIHIVLAITIGFSVLSSTNAQQTETLTVTYPTTGERVGGQLIARGVAEIPPGKHLWVLARRVDFGPLWWPQRQARVDPIRHEWEAQAVLGGPQDIGW